MGILRRVAMMARVMNGIYVSLTPLRCSYFAFSFSRMRTIPVRSILKQVWTWGLMRLESTMRCAMIERMRVRGTSSPGWGPAAGAGLAAAGAAATGAGAAGAGTGATGAGTAGAAAAVAFPPGPFSARYCRTFSLVMRPADPVPVTLVRSRLLSLAILRTRGEDRTDEAPPSTASSVSASDSAAGVAAGGAAAIGAAAATGGVAAAGAAAVPPAAPPGAPPITATTVLIWTVDP